MPEVEDNCSQTATQEERSDPDLRRAKDAWRPFIRGVDWAPLTEESALSLLVRGPTLKKVDFDSVVDGATAWDGWADQVKV